MLLEWSYLQWMKLWTFQIDDTSCLTENSPSCSNGLMFFNVWMTNPFEQADVFDERMAKPFNGCFYWMDDQSHSNGCKFFWTADKQVVNGKLCENRKGLVYILPWEVSFFWALLSQINAYFMLEVSSSAVQLSVLFWSY